MWQKAMDLVVRVYRVTDAFPKAETYGLVSQMRRSAISIPSNIAEGRRRGTDKDFKHFLHIAFGSSAELDTQIELAERLSFLNQSELGPLKKDLSEIMRMLNGLISFVDSKLV